MTVFPEPAVNHKATVSRTTQEVLESLFSLTDSVAPQDIFVALFPSLKFF